MEPVGEAAGPNRLRDREGRSDRTSARSRVVLRKQVEEMVAIPHPARVPNQPGSPLSLVLAGRFILDSLFVVVSLKVSGVIF